MRILLIAIGILFSLLTFSQTKTVKIAEDKFGEVVCTYQKTIRVESKDTSYLLILAFRNLEYPSLNEWGGIGFNKQNDIKQLIADIKSVMEETNKDKTSDIVFERELFSVKSMPWGAGKHLRIYEPSNKVTSFTVLTHKQAESLIKWLDKIEIGEEPIKK